MFVAEPFTNIKGEFVDINDVLNDVENILGKVSMMMLMKVDLDI